MRYLTLHIANTFVIRAAVSSFQASFVAIARLIDIYSPSLKAVDDTRGISTRATFLKHPTLAFKALHKAILMMANQSKNVQQATFLHVENRLISKTQVLMVVALLSYSLERDELEQVSRASQ